MSAQSLQIITLTIPNPEWQTWGDNDQATRVNASLSFNYLSSFNIRTLSSQNANNGADVTGLLYIPDIADDSPCRNTTAPYIPQNATRKDNLPMTDYNLVAIAPWVTPECSLEYMEGARMDPINGFVFFVPGDSPDTPPRTDSDHWHIPNSDDWKTRNGYPVYAINGQSGTVLMDASASYSGNMTDVPNGHQLTEVYDPRDYVRLWVDINTGSGSSLPSLWVFLLVVLGILLAIIGITSLSMHWLQRQRRQTLRRRVQTGEVDLEALGIKRLVVPQDILNKMPLYTYGTRKSSEGSQEASKASLGFVEEKRTPGLASQRPNVERSTTYRPTALSQPTCAICLDDFVAPTADQEGTMVRELPCHHIFHPECVDTFLRDSSSLCPMCKKTALPRGYCPRVITNAMVRRERMIRQVRERVLDDPDAADEVYPTTFSARVRSMSGFRYFRSSRRLSSAPISNNQQMVQFNSDRPPGTANSRAPLTQRDMASETIESTPTPQVQPPATASHAGWARQRAERMLGRRAPEDPDAEEVPGPAWRKAMRNIFPRR